AGVAGSGHRLQHMAVSGSALPPPPRPARLRASPEESPMSQIESRLAELGVTLPDAPAPAANYVPFVVVGNLVHISGQISQNDEGLIKGRLGDGMSVEQGAEAANRCAVSLLAQLKKACGGDLSRLVRA